MNMFKRFFIVTLFIFTLVCSPTYSNIDFSIDGYSFLNAGITDLVQMEAINPGTSIFTQDLLAHGGGLNSCGCHFNRKTGECHCHRDRGCGCECQSNRCD